MQNLYHGAAFYPELWDEEIIEQDIKLMKETGINVARIGEVLFLNLLMQRLWESLKGGLVLAWHLLQNSKLVKVKLLC